MAHVTIAWYSRIARSKRAALHRSAGSTGTHASAGGASRTMSGKRKRSTGSQPVGGDDREDEQLGSAVDDAASSMASKYRESLDGAANEFLCPITQELPVEPVTAMDGKVYERWAIEDWFRQGNGNSPMTNQPMSRQLLPATHVRNSLELMVKSGALTGEKVDAWQKKLKDEQSIAKLLEKAQAGDVRSMERLGDKLDMQEKYADALAWFQRGADAGSMACLTMLGRYHVYGLGGGERQLALGVVMVTEAATNGNEHACWLLGYWFKNGLAASGFTLERDYAQAAKWYRKMSHCGEGVSLTLEASLKQTALDWLSEYDEEPFSAGEW